MSSIALAFGWEIVMAHFKRQHTLRTPVTAMLGLLLLASESAGAQGVVLSLPPEDQQMIAAQLGPIVGRALPSTPIEDASIYFPLQEKVSIYRFTTGRDAGKTQRLGLAKVRRPNGESAWRFQFTPSLAGFIRQTPEGDLIIPAVGDTGDGVVVVTTPANPFVVKGMKPGETRYYVQQVVVYPLDDAAYQEYSGSLKGSYTYLGAYQVMVPAGTYGAVLFRLKCEGKVGPARTHDTAYYFFAAGKGVIAMINQEEATAFWFIHIDTTTGEVLIAN
jgi:hypothetical protein